jgi:hypothetical protein
MSNKKKKALVFNPPANNLEHDLIIANKTYTVKELNAIFNVHSLSMITSKEKLIEYWEMAVETGVARFISAVDYVFQQRYPKYE